MAKIEEALPEELVQSFTTETPADEAPKAPRPVLSVGGSAVGRRKEPSPARASRPAPARTS